ncbi:MAG: DNA repair protein RecO [Lachnospiraceae bacterium]|nr:DNA repair protein RecO [Lachnospiraceae bacterium]
MSEPVNATGMILKAYDYSEYDRRLIVLTREFGKITVFAKGVRRINSRFMAASEPLVYGRFKLFEGKSAYNLGEAEISNYFEDIRLDMENLVYASFFCDLAEYCTRENVDESDILKLLYRALQALLSKNLDNGLIASAFQFKLIMLNGEYPGVDAENVKNAGTRDAISYIGSSDIKNIFAFKVNDEIKLELAQIAKKRRRAFVAQDLKSIEVMNDFGYNI